MTWQIAILLQIIASSIMTLYTRRLSLSIKKVFFGVAVLSYVSVAFTGWIYSLVATGGQPTLPDGEIWPLLVIEGIFIPAAWLVQYRLIAYIGASNAIIVTTLNILTTAVAGILFLHEPISFAFVIGGLLILNGVLIALHLQPDTVHHVHIPLAKKIMLAAAGSILFSIGMFAEKIAVDHMGAWDYMGFGWSMQTVGALVLFALFGRKELRHLSKKAVSSGLVLGVLTSIAGGLYIYAVSIGSLSHTIVATSGKAALVMILAALLFKERNMWTQRLAALGLTVIGLYFVLG